MAAGEKHPVVARLAVPVVASAVGADFSGVARAPFAGTVTGVTYVPTVLITGAATNSRTLSVTNHLQDGTGSTSVASLALVAGVNAAAFDEKAVTLSGTAANLAVADGDILEFKSLHIGTGIADPGGTAYITISRS